MNAKQLRDLADDLFKKKSPLNSLHQEIADNFYPERADFTIDRSMGADFAANLMSSYPVLCRRDLGNTISTMLRPSARPWFHPGIRYEKSPDNETKAHLEWFEETQRRAMYDPSAMLSRATKEADHDFAGFGQFVMSIELSKNKDTLLYRTWHLRDCCWQENADGKVGTVFRKWKPTVQTLCRTFKNLDQKIIDMNAKTPFELHEVLHMVIDADMYDEDAKGRPRWSIWYDMVNNVIIEAVPIWNGHYITPRWQTVSGSQYSFSPATVAALPDARLIQAMTYTLLEAGEKAVSPPMIAVQDAVRSDVAVYSGGITWVDQEYDERLGAALRPLEQDFRGFNYGLQMNQDTRGMLHKAFFLDNLNLPVRTAAMTAYEVSQHVQEYIRNALPLFEPMEMEYNASLCDESFDLLWRNGAFGNPRSWPKALQGADIDFSFESPLHDAIEQMKGHQFTEASQLIAQAVSLDPTAAFVPKVEVALRDALTGVGVPAKWLNSEAEVVNARKQAAQQTAQQQTLANMEQASNTVKNMGQSGMVPAAQ